MKVKFNMDLNIDGNAFSVLGAFSREAKRNGWTKDEIEEWMVDATSKDYDHLLQCVVKWVEDDEEYDEEKYYEEKY